MDLHQYFVVLGYRPVDFLESQNARRAVLVVDNRSHAFTSSQRSLYSMAGLRDGLGQVHAKRHQPANTPACESPCLTVVDDRDSCLAPARVKVLASDRSGYFLERAGPSGYVTMNHCA